MQPLSVIIAPSHRASAPRSTAAARRSSARIRNGLSGRDGRCRRPPSGRRQGNTHVFAAFARFLCTMRLHAMGVRQESKDAGGDPPATYPHLSPGVPTRTRTPFANLHIEAHIAGPYLWCS
jgi:hypothetical protein